MDTLFLIFCISAVILLGIFLYACKEAQKDPRGPVPVWLLLLTVVDVTVCFGCLGSIFFRLVFH